MATNGTNEDGPANEGLTLAIIGCGTMGSAILSGVLVSCARSEGAGESPKFTHFLATVQSEASAEKLRTRFSSYGSHLEVVAGDNVKAMQRADVILLACKPYLAEKVLTQMGVAHAVEGKLIISVLVGSPVEKLKNFIVHCHGNPASFVMPGEVDRRIYKNLYIKRAMLNLAAEHGQSMTVIESTPMPEYYEDISQWIFSQVGKTAPVAPDLYDVGGVLAGASSAFLSVAFDGILDGAVKEGMKRADARKILTQSLFSLATLLQEGEHPAVLREKYSSPKGTTIEGLQSLEEDRVRYAFSKCIIASSKRSKDIGK
ncbi:pyrroline-5-carboxylate reductase [Tricladium varicosporioides]|nr:pyrroline-5-carboxylate reductase [Hymenoscyphus varicosporioides]